MSATKLIQFVFKETLLTIIFLTIAPKESIKHVILDCDYQIVRDLIVQHVNDIYMGRRRCINELAR